MLCQLTHMRDPVVPNPEHAKSPTLLKDVAAYVAEKLAPHKRLRGGVIVLEAIPKRCVKVLGRFQLASSRRVGQIAD